MQIAHLIINLNTDQPEQMDSFYRNALGLEPIPEMGPSSFHLGPASLVLDTHSDVHGRAAQPGRLLLNLWVDDLAAEKARLDAAGVSFIRPPEREEWGGLFSTFLDPDGNYLQLMEFKP